MLRLLKVFCLLVPKIASWLTGSAVANTYTVLTSTNVAGALGAGTAAKAIYDELAPLSAQVSIMPAATADDAGFNAAIAKMGDTVEKDKLGGGTPDFILYPSYPAKANTADVPLTTLKQAMAVGQGLELATVFTDAIQDTVTNSSTWADNNAGDGVMAAANEADVTGWPSAISSEAKGSVHLLDQYLRYFGARGTAINPIGERFPISVSGVSPVRPFNYSDGSSPAQTLASKKLSVFTRVEGVWSVWGGDMKVAPVSSPLYTVANRLAAKQIIQFTRQRAGRFLFQQRVRPISIQLSIQRELNTHYVNTGLAAVATVGAVSLTGRTLNVPLRLGWIDAPNEIVLDVTVERVEG